MPDIYEDSFVLDEAQDNFGFADAVSGPLPIAMGGTGATSVEGARESLGITLPLPVASGGTGATTVAAAVAALGLTPDKTLTIANVPAESQRTGDTFEAYIHGNNDRLFQVYLPCVNGKYSSSALTAYHMGNLFFCNGTTTSSNTRVAITGTDLDVYTSQPTYERKPNWYVNDIPGFVIGHEYLFEIVLLSGVYAPVTETDTVKITIRNTDSLNTTIGSGEVWLCTAKPQMACVLLKPATYTNCAYFIKITDLTVRNQELVLQELPNYWQTYMAAKASVINLATGPKPGSGTRFIFITDTHLREADGQWRNAMWSPLLMQYLHDHCNIGLAFFGGDALVGNYATMAVAMADMELFRAAFAPVWEWMNCIIGNHDYGNNNPVQGADWRFTRPMLYNMLIRDKEFCYSEVNYSSPTEAGCSYILDDPNEQIRFICMNCNEGGNYTQQCGWFADALINTELGWTIVVIAHYSIDPNDSTQLSGKLTATYSLVPTIDAYNARVASYATSGSSTVSFASGAAEVACIIGGHCHFDGNLTTPGVDDHPGVPVIATTCDMYCVNESPLTGRTRYTTTEQAFDVFTIDTNAKTITTTRIGAGSDRSFTYGS